MKVRAISLLVIALLTVCHADESIIEYTGVQKANSLSGVIRDKAGVPIPQVTVQEMSDDWTTVFQTTATDVNGRWVFPKERGKKVHQIRFKKNTFHELRFRVKLTRKKAKPLDFEMSVS
jgi:hypothetical protein